MFKCDSVPTNKFFFRAFLFFYMDVKTKPDDRLSNDIDFGMAQKWMNVSFTSFSCRKWLMVGTHTTKTMQHQEVKGKWISQWCSPLYFYFRDLCLHQRSDLRSLNVLGIHVFLHRWTSISTSECIS